MLENVRADLHRYSAVPEISWLRAAIIACDFAGFQATAIYRFGRWVDRHFAHPLLWPLRAALLALHWILRRLARALLGIDIARDADIGPGFYIGHFGSVHIGRCHIGAHCSVNQHAYVAANARGEAPHIGDRVWIGAHARVCGGVRIEDGATVAAGAVVAGDIKAKSLVTGNPARVIAIDYDNAGLL